MASRLSPSSSQSSLSASNSSLFEPERRPPDSPPAACSSATVSSPLAGVHGASVAGQQTGTAAAGDSGGEEASATFTIKRKKKRKAGLTRAATIDDPSFSSSTCTTASSSTASSPRAQAGSSSEAAAGLPTLPTFDMEDLRLAFSLMDANQVRVLLRDTMCPRASDKRKFTERERASKQVTLSDRCSRFHVRLPRLMAHDGNHWWCTHTHTRSLLSAMMRTIAGTDCHQDGRISCSELWSTLAALGFSASFSTCDIQNMIRSASEGCSLPLPLLLPYAVSSLCSHCSP